MGDEKDPDDEYASFVQRRKDKELTPWNLRKKLNRQYDIDDAEIYAQLVDRRQRGEIKGTPASLRKRIDEKHNPKERQNYDPDVEYVKVVQERDKFQKGIRTPTLLKQKLDKKYNESKYDAVRERKKLTPVVEKVVVPADENRSLQHVQSKAAGEEAVGERKSPPVPPPRNRGGKGLRPSPAQQNIDKQQAEQKQIYEQIPGRDRSNAVIKLDAEVSLVKPKARRAVSQPNAAQRRRIHVSTDFKKEAAQSRNRIISEEEPGAPERKQSKVQEVAKKEGPANIPRRHGFIEIPLSSRVQHAKEMKRKMDQKQHQVHFLKLFKNQPKHPKNSPNWETSAFFDGFEEEHTLNRQSNGSHSGSRRSSESLLTAEDEKYGEPLQGARQSRIKTQHQKQTYGRSPSVRGSNATLAPNGSPEKHAGNKPKTPSLQRSGSQKRTPSKVKISAEEEEAEFPPPAHDVADEENPPAMEDIYKNVPDDIKIRITANKIEECLDLDKIALYYGPDATHEYKERVNNFTFAQFIKRFEIDDANCKEIIQTAIANGPRPMPEHVLVQKQNENNPKTELTEGEKLLASQARSKTKLQSQPQEEIKEKQKSKSKSKPKPQSVEDEYESKIGFRLKTCPSYINREYFDIVKAFAEKHKQIVLMRCAVAAAQGTEELLACIEELEMLNSVFLHYNIAILESQDKLLYQLKNVKAKQYPLIQKYDIDMIDNVTFSTLKQIDPEKLNETLKQKPKAGKLYGYDEWLNQFKYGFEPGHADYIYPPHIFNDLNQQQLACISKKRYRIYVSDSNSLPVDKMSSKDFLEKFMTKDKCKEVSRDIDKHKLTDELIEELDIDPEKVKLNPDGLNQINLLLSNKTITNERWKLNFKDAYGHDFPKFIRNKFSKEQLKCIDHIKFNREFNAFLDKQKNDFINVVTNGTYSFRRFLHDYPNGAYCKFTELKARAENAIRKKVDTKEKIRQDKLDAFRRKFPLLKGLATVEEFECIDETKYKEATPLSKQLASDYKFREIYDMWGNPFNAGCYIKALRQPKEKLIVRPKDQK